MYIYIYILYIYIYKCNISSIENNHRTKFVICVRAGGKPPAGWITNFVLIIFWASCVIYLSNMYIYIYIYRGVLYYAFFELAVAQI